MALRNRIENGVGMLAAPEIQEPKEGQVAGVVTYLAGLFKNIVTAINGRLSLGNAAQSSQSGNIDGQWITYVFPSSANTEVEIPHGLGRVPVGFFVGEKDKACDVYTSNRSGWGKERIYLKCDTATATVNMLVF